MDKGERELRSDRKLETEQNDVDFSANISANMSNINTINILIKRQILSQWLLKNIYCYY